MTDSISNLLYNAVSSGAAHDTETFVGIVLRDALGWPIPHESFKELPYE